MANYNQKGWLDTAMDQIRCKPEHKVIRAELQSHLEDKEQFFLDAGMEPRQAARAAVAAMGDPVEVGKELDKAHPVFWGKLYSALKGVAVLCCLALLFCFVDYAANYDLDALLQNYPLKVVRTDPYEMGGEDVVVLDVPDKPIRHSGYRIKVLQAYWSPEVYSGEENVLEVDVKVSNPRPWAVTPLFMRRIDVDGYSGQKPELLIALSQGDRVFLCNAAYLSSGEIVRGRLMDQNNNNLDDYRYWDSWYFTFSLPGVEPGDTVTLYHPDHEELAMTFEVEVTQ